MNKTHRILAVLGVALVAAAVLTMLASGFTPALRDLLLNISLICTAGAGAILLALMFIRNREKEKEEP